MNASLKRETFTTSREHEYFSESELVTQTGHPREDWFPCAIVKELVDNALDACEQAGIPPVIRITLEGGSLTISDNGPGIPSDVVSRILDFTTRTSDKQAYISPTRGAQGNALKTVLGMAYVLNDGEPATVEIEARRVKHRITVSMDQIKRSPKIGDVLTKSGRTQGTTVRLKTSSEDTNGASLADLIQDYALFNPHARFLLDVDGDREEWQATNRAWEKWLPSDPTSPHWYTAEQLENLIASYIAAEHTGSPAKTVREFVSEFRGLSATAKQKTVSAKAHLERAYLHDLVHGERLDRNKITRLLKAMQAESTPVKGDLLGPLGEGHFKARLVKNHAPAGTGEASLQDSDAEEEIVQIALAELGVEIEDFHRTWGYRRLTDTKDGLPMVVEVGFCMTEDPSMQGLHLGLNWSPAPNNALEKDTYNGREGFQAFLENNYIDIDEDPIALVVHLICPRFDFLDRGKGTVSLSGFSDLFVKAVLERTKQWSKIKQKEDRQQRQAAAQARHRFIHGRSPVKPKDVAYEVMAEAYHKAAGKRGLARSRQVYYVAREKILNRTGEPELKGPTFQGWLKEYQRDFPEETADWDVIYDARGSLVEPHTDKEVGLGTLEVREYISRVPDMSVVPQISTRFPTCGPEHRYSNLLFIEKEGWRPLLEQARIAERYDIAIEYNKGLSTAAARDLLHNLYQRGVKILVMHDFDVAGFNILGTLTRDTETYQHETEIEVVDLGLRLEDVERWRLESEPVTFKRTPKRETLAKNGARPEEIKFLMGGRRVELNAFTSDDFIAWLESKFEKHGVKKIVPDQKTLELAYRRAAAIARYREILEDAQQEVEKYAVGLKVPAGLGRIIRQDLNDDPEMAWDDAVQAALERTREESKK